VSAALDVLRADLEAVRGARPLDRNMESERAIAAVADLVEAVRAHRDSVTLGAEREARERMYAALAAFGESA
jgi:hypothetical protein